MKYPFLEKYGQHSGDYLGLSLAGAIKIAPYPEECHKEAFDEYVSAEKIKKITIKDPLRFYIYLCNDYCKTRFVDPDFPELVSLAHQYNIDASTDVYLPEEQRIHVEIEDHAKKQTKKPYEGNPYRPVTGTWKKSVHEFQFSPTSTLDHIAESIKLIGYLAAGIQCPGTAVVLTSDCFAKRAAFTIEELMSHDEHYKLDLAAIISQVDKFIEYTLEVHKDLPFIKQISCAEDAKIKAHEAIAQFVPVLLRPFILKGAGK